MTTLEDINHDSGPPVSNHWTTVTDPGGRLSITGVAALDGTANGLQIDFSSTNNADVIEPYTPPGSNELRLRFRYDPNTPATPSVSSATLVRVVLSEDGTVFGDLLGRISIGKNVAPGSELQAFFVFGDDSTPLGSTAGNSIITDEPHCFEMVFKRAVSAVSNDGSYDFLIDSVSQFSDATVDNYDLFPTIDNIWVRADVMEVAMSGTDTYIDEFLLTDVEGVGLCAAAAFSGYDLVLGGGQL